MLDLALSSQAACPIKIIKVYDSTSSTTAATDINPTVEQITTSGVGVQNRVNVVQEKKIIPNTSGYTFAVHYEAAGGATANTELITLKVVCGIKSNVITLPTKYDTPFTNYILGSAPFKPFVELPKPAQANINCPYSDDTIPILTYPGNNNVGLDTVVDIAATDVGGTVVDKV